MGTWTKTAPTLPYGSQWTVYAQQSVQVTHYSIRATIACVRLTGKRYVIRFQVYAGGAESYAEYYDPPDNFVLVVYKNGTQESTTKLGWKSSVSQGTTQTIYYIGEADGGTTIKAQTGNDRSSSTNVQRSFAVPEELGGFCVKIGGVWKNAVPWVKVGGAWRQAAGRIKVNGEWV